MCPTGAVWKHDLRRPHRRCLYCFVDQMRDDVLVWPQLLIDIRDTLAAVPALIEDDPPCTGQIGELLRQCSRVERGNIHIENAGADFSDRGEHQFRNGIKEESSPLIRLAVYLQEPRCAITHDFNAGHTADGSLA